MRKGRPTIYLHSIAAVVVLLFLSSATQKYFERYAALWKVELLLLEGICRYESDSGRILVHKNKNGSWDVGYCMNHRKKSKNIPKIPSRASSIREAAKELAYWERQHNKYCVKLYEEKGKCGIYTRGKWRGVKDCWRPHFWWAHYNWGYRVLQNNYGHKVQCFIDNKFKKCDKNRWQTVNF